MSVSMSPVLHVTVQYEVSKIMIPDMMNCSSSWTREYYGYIMAEMNGHNSSMSYEYIDINAENNASSGGSEDGALFYFTETGISYPPYEAGIELSAT